jgi:hypothetical protein
MAMFDMGKLTEVFIGTGVNADLARTEVDGRDAALVTVVGSGGKKAQRIFTEADLASPKLAAQVERFCKQVLP